VTPTAPSDYSVGSFVTVVSAEYRGLGIGRLFEIDGETCVVEFCDVPGEARPPRVRVPIDEVRSSSLPEQTRVYRLTDDGRHWQVGRVLDGEGDEILIQFPNKDIVTLPREEIYIRWRKPILDPAGFLARAITETPMFAEARSHFIRVATRQRAACLGMTAILSSRVQLTDYQFNVVRRVLEDPIQRYLLADEVGLGKTIEAGMLIRQYVLDMPAVATVLIIVPRVLVSQWREELITRFSLAGWLDDFIHIVPSDDLDTIGTRLIDVGMLVVDEAHHLARQATKADKMLYDLLSQVAPRIKRVLFLSATPVLADTIGFHRVLHLLDPLVFPIDDFRAFERRLESRQLIAEVVAALVPENALVIDQELDRLISAFDDDEILSGLIAAIRPVIMRLPDKEDPELVDGLALLRAHLSETYRLHRRILRNRRRDVEWATPIRSGMEPYLYRCAATGERLQALEDIRGTVANMEQESSPEVPSVLFASAVNPHTTDSLATHLRRVGVVDDFVLRRASDFDRCSLERDREQRIRATSDVVREHLARPGTQVVVFCDATDVADAVAASITRANARGAVERHRLPDMDADGLADELGEASWRRFLNDPDDCRVLVCDASAEEGLNLHGGRKVVVHFDLPPAPNRIEQRLGRLDRFGSGEPIKSIVLLCEGDVHQAAWIRCLSDGFNVFGTSIAALQYLVEKVTSGLPALWLGRGAAAIDHLTENLSGPAGLAKREIRRINQQDQLDALIEAQSDAFDELEAEDGRWAQFGEAFESFAFQSLQFNRQHVPMAAPLVRGDRVFRVGFARDTARVTQLPLSTFVSHFMGALDVDAPGGSSRNPLTFPYSLRRATGLGREGTALQIRPLRIGDPLVDALIEFCGADDRGRAFALWRFRDSYEVNDASGVDLFFRFDFLVEPSSLEVEDSFKTLSSDTDSAWVRALRRRADAILRPSFITIWTHGDGQVLKDGPESATDPYRSSPRTGTGRDYNLNPSRWRKIEGEAGAAWLQDWGTRCFRARDAALQHLVESSDHRDRISAAVRAATVQFETNAGRIASRLSRLTEEVGSVEQAEWDQEKAFHESILRAVGNPSIRLDVIGAVFVSSSDPFIS
jgi:ATP-dependent helicase HepA